jgi:putative DNA primase/helicase
MNRTGRHVTGLKGPIALVLSRLENVVELSSGWSAQCPGHDDELNSLSIAEGDDGRALLFCHAGCNFEDIVDALGLRVRELFVQRRGRR